MAQWGIFEHPSAVAERSLVPYWLAKAGQAVIVQLVSLSWLFSFPLDELVILPVADLSAEVRSKLQPLLE